MGSSVRGRALGVVQTALCGPFCFVETQRCCQRRPIMTFLFVANSAFLDLLSVGGYFYLIASISLNLAALPLLVPKHRRGKLKQMKMSCAPTETTFICRVI